MVEQVEHKVADLSPNPPMRFEFFDSSGNPLKGMKVKVKLQDGEQELEVDDKGEVDLQSDSEGEVEVQVTAEAEKTD